MMHRAWSSIVEMPYCFSRSYIKIQGHTALKIVEFDPNWAFPGYEMLHKAWNSKGEVPYCFPRSSIKFQGHTGQTITDFDPNWAFPDYRPVAAFKSLRFACFHCFCFWLYIYISYSLICIWYINILLHLHYFQLSSNVIFYKYPCNLIFHRCLRLTIMFNTLSTPVLCSPFTVFFGIGAHYTIIPNHFLSSQMCLKFVLGS